MASPGDDVLAFKALDGDWYFLDQDGSSGDSFWTYATGTLEPDSATTTPLDTLTATATTDVSFTAPTFNVNAIQIDPTGGSVGDVLTLTGTGVIELDTPTSPAPTFAHSMLLGGM